MVIEKGNMWDVFGKTDHFIITANSTIKSNGGLVKADINLISLSTKELLNDATTRPELRYDLNFPGIGCGGLTEEEVHPIISVFPNNVHVWKYE